MSKLLRKIMWCFFLIACLWLGGLVWFVTLIPSTLSESTEKADAIVVLTGGKNRLEYGLKLLAEGKSEKLFISGVHEAITESQLVKLAPPELRRKVTQMDEGAITLGREAWNTIGNAEETKRWLQEQNVKSILLVTSNYHMPRSFYEFRHLVKGVKIIPMPVPAEDYDLTNWWSNEHYRVLVFLEYHKYMASMVRNALIPTMKQL